MSNKEAYIESREEFLSMFRSRITDADFCGRCADLFYDYYVMLAAKNEKINLTAITEPEEVIEKHFLDSLQPYFLGIIKDCSFVADVGSGAGFPGIPLAIALPHCRFTLIEPIKKRADFLLSVINVLSLKNCEVFAVRSEDAAKALRESFDVVCSRAVSRLNILSEYCLPLVKVGGKMVALKGPAAEEEISEAINAVSLLGGDTPLLVPCHNESRNIVSVTKISPTPAKYPRRAGIPEKRPL